MKNNEAEFRYAVTLDRNGLVPLPGDKNNLMSIFEYFMFCLREQQWPAPVTDNQLPAGLFSDEL